MQEQDSTAGFETWLNWSSEEASAIEQSIIEAHRDRAVVYMVGSQELERVKIGVSTVVSERLATLRSCSPSPLVLVAAIRGSYWTEARIHETASGSRLHGEWFSWTQEVYAAFTGAYAAPPPKMSGRATRPAPKPRNWDIEPTGEEVAAYHERRARFLAKRKRFIRVPKTTRRVGAHGGR